MVHRRTVLAFRTRTCRSAGTPNRPPAGRRLIHLISAVRGHLTGHSSPTTVWSRGPATVPFRRIRTRPRLAACGPGPVSCRSVRRWWTAVARRQSSTCWRRPDLRCCARTHSDRGRRRVFCRRHFFTGKSPGTGWAGGLKTTPRGKVRGESAERWVERCDKVRLLREIKIT